MSEKEPAAAGQRVDRAALAVLGVWLGPVVLSLLPNDWRSIRAIGITLDWWYVGIAAPLLIVALILYFTSHKRSSG